MVGVVLLVGFVVFVWCVVGEVVVVVFGDFGELVGWLVGYGW